MGVVPGLLCQQMLPVVSYVVSPSKQACLVWSGATDRLVQIRIFSGESAVSSFREER